MKENDIFIKRDELYKKYFGSSVWSPGFDACLIAAIILEETKNG